MVHVQEIAELNLPDLSDLSVVEVLPFDLAGLPPVGVLEQFRDDLSDHEFIGRRDVWGGHRCERCSGKNSPNPDYIPGDEYAADPCAWVWIRYVDGPNKYRQYGLITDDVVLCRESKVDTTVDEFIGDNELIKSVVFFTSPYFPCRHSFDWSALAALTVLATPPPDVTETIVAAFAADGIDITRSEISSYDGGRMHMIARRDRARYYLIVETMEKYEQKFEDGELDDIRKTLRVADFGSYPWSVQIPEGYNEI